MIKKILDDNIHLFYKYPTLERFYKDNFDPAILVVFVNNENNDM